MVTKKTWEEFREAGMLWWINMILHTFGWTIIMEIENEKVIEVYPARVKFRGFDTASNSQGYIKVTKFMKDNAGTLFKEAKE